MYDIFENFKVTDSIMDLQEEHFERAMPEEYISQDECKRYLLLLCNIYDLPSCNIMVDSRPIDAVYPYSPPMNAMCDAKNKIIHFYATSNLIQRTILHEFSHYVDYHKNGGKYAITTKDGKCHGPANSWADQYARIINACLWRRHYKKTLESMHWYERLKRFRSNKDVEFPYNRYLVRA